MVPSSCTIGAVSHLSMQSSAHLHVTCFRTARSRSPWSILSNRPLMSNSRTQSYFQHRLVFVERRNLGRELDAFVGSNREHTDFSVLDQRHGVADGATCDRGVAAEQRLHHRPAAGEWHHHEVKPKRESQHLDRK